MKRIACLALIGLLISLPAARAETLKLAGSAWPPYIDPTREDKGVAMDLVRHIFQRAGYETTAYVASWPRTLEGASIGVVDVIAAAWKTPEREKTLHFTDPYFVNVIKFVKRRDAPIRFRSFADLKGLMIATVVGYAYGDAFANARDIVRVPTNHVAQSLMLLERRKVDLAIGDQWVIRNELTRYFPRSIRQFEFLRKPVDERPLHVAISRENPRHAKIVADFNRALKAMKADGTYDRLIDGYRKQFVNLIEAPL